MASLNFKDENGNWIKIKGIVGEKGDTVAHTGATEPLPEKRIWIDTSSKTLPAIIDNFKISTDTCYSSKDIYEYVENQTDSLMIDYFGHSINAKKTLQSEIKDFSILGKTINNLSDFEKEEVINGVRKTQNTGIVRGKTYTFIATVKEVSGEDQGGYLYSIKYKSGTSHRIWEVTPAMTWAKQIGTTVAIKYTILEEVEDMTSWNRSGANGSVTIENSMILEGDWTNTKIPPFFKDEMKSVGDKDKNLTIKVTGKNIFDVHDFADKCGGYVENNTYYSSGSKDNYIYNIEAKAPSTFSFIALNNISNAAAIKFIFSDNSFSYIAGNKVGQFTQPLTKDLKSIEIINYSKNWVWKDIQLEEGGFSEYQEHLNENYTIQNIPSIRSIFETYRDEITSDGFYIQRIEQLKLTGRFNRNISENDVYFRATFNDYRYIGAWDTPQAYCNKLPYSVDFAYNLNGEAIAVDNNGQIYICLKKSRGISDLKTLNEYIDNENFIIMLLLREPIVKNSSAFSLSSYNDSTNIYPKNQDSVPVISCKIKSLKNSIISSISNELEVLDDIIEEKTNMLNKADINLLSNDFDVDFRLLELEINNEK